MFLRGAPQPKRVGSYGEELSVNDLAVWQWYEDESRWLLIRAATVRGRGRPHVFKPLADARWSVWINAERFQRR